MQRAIHEIDRAAEMDPAPDLVVLPAFVDTCVDSPDDVLEKGVGPTAATCGFRARSWGVFVAMGMAERARPRPRLNGLLFDHDGDDLLIQSLTRPGTALAERFDASTERLEAAETLLGRIAVLVDDDIVDEASWNDVVAGGAQLIVGVVGAGATSEKSFASALSDLAKRFHRPVVVADVTTCGKKGAVRRRGVSRIVAADGEVVAEAEADTATILVADLTLPAAAVVDESVATSGSGD